MKIRHWGLLGVGLLLATPLGAQDAEAPPTALEAGAYSLSFRLPESGTGNIGFWRMVSDQINLGLNFDLSIRSHTLDDGTTGRTERRQRITVQPIVARYLATATRVTPFLFGAVLVTFNRTDTTESNTRTGIDGHSMHYGVSGGGGVEWFVVPQVSVGGRAGLQLGLSNGSEEFGSSRHEEGLFLNTFTTNLILKIYFR